jgi:hypothetical protein
MDNQQVSFLQEINRSVHSNMDDFDETNVKPFIYEIKDLSNLKLNNDLFIRALYVE